MVTDRVLSQIYTIGGKMLRRWGKCVLMIAFALTLLLAFAGAALGNTVREEGDWDNFVYLPLILRDYVPGLIPVEGVVVEGPVAVTVGEEVHLSATYTPTNATTPLSYTWSASGLLSGQGTSATVYGWDEVGEYAGVLTVTNCGRRRVVTAPYGAFVTGPAIGGIQPADREKGVGLDTVVTITFTDEVVTGTASYTATEIYTAFHVLEQGFYDMLSGTLVLEGATLHFTPTALLSETSYVFVVNEGLRDINGAAGLQAIATEEEILPDQASYYFSTVTTDTARAQHPISGQRNILLNDVAYDVDSSSRLTITELYEMITAAHENATAYYTATDVLTGWSEPPSVQFINHFHFWPNIIDLTAVYTQDVSLYDFILDELLARETAPHAQQLRANLDSEVVTRDRIYLARDFVTQATYDFQTYFEVGYALLINLDERYYTEVLIHRSGEDGMPTLHDPHTEELAGIFAGAGAAPLGKVWDLCLRGNFKRHKYDAIVVDKLEQSGLIFFIERVAMDCGGMNHLRDETFDPTTTPDQPWKPWNPIMPITEPLPIPENPNFGPSSTTTTTTSPPVFTPSSAVNPWPFLLPELTPYEEAGDEAPSEGEVGECNPEEIAGIITKTNQLQTELDQRRQEREEDMESFNGNPDEHTYGSRYKWDSDASFNDDCIQGLFEEYDPQIDALQAEVDGLEAEISALYDQLEGAEEALGPVIQALLHRDSLWENMLWVIGEWHDVDPEPCMPPWIPGGGSPFEDGSGNSVIIIGIEEQRKFQVALARALSGSYEFNEDGSVRYVPGLPFDEAVDAALSDSEVYKFTNAYGQEVTARQGDSVMSMIWRRFAQCLKRLYSKMLDKYLKAVYGDDLTADQLEQMKQVMFEGEEALTAAQRQQLEDYKENNKDLRDQIAQLRAQADVKKKEIDRLRNKFRERALDCFEASLENIYRLRLRIRILQAFLIWCEDPSAEEALPWYIEGHLDRFCEVLREMQDSADYGPSFRTYVQMLLDYNCSARGHSVETGSWRLWYGPQKLGHR
jgi:cell division protein FtsB